MGNIYSSFTYDDALNLMDSAAVDTTGNGSIIVDLGDGLFDGYLVCDITAMEKTTGDEKYRIAVEGSTVAAMTSTSVGLNGIDLGDFVAPMDADDTIITSVQNQKRLTLPFRNERLGTLYRYVRLHYTISGTTPSITMTAFIAKS